MDRILGAGPRIRKWRKTRGLTGDQLAKIIKVSQGSLSDIENSKSNPSAPTIVSFIQKTDINVEWMLTGETGDINKGNIPTTEQSILRGIKKLIKHYKD